STPGGAIPSKESEVGRRRVSRAEFDFAAVIFEPGAVGRGRCLTPPASSWRKHTRRSRLRGLGATVSLDAANSPSGGSSHEKGRVQRLGPCANSCGSSPIRRLARALPAELEQLAGLGVDLGGLRSGCSRPYESIESSIV